MHPKKSLGQNFLISDIPPKKMVEELEIETGDFVYEIGPGKAALTKHLLEKKSTINFEYLGIEKDDTLYTELTKTYQNTRFVNKDVLEYLKYQQAAVYKVCGSLPYNAATNIINLLCKLPFPPKLCVFLVQYEFGLKLAASDGLNAPAAFVQGFYDVQVLKKVKNTLFFPIPKVDGVILKLDYKRRDIDPFKYEKFIKRFFTQPRKMMNKVFNKTELEIMRLDEKLRPSDFQIEEILKAYLLLNDKSPLRAS